ncbi:hypothetical protein EPVG_00015 [Emiliania huxleyi virus 201]|nr:hypothetical protein ELVG_00184 [Emiliania huxleyi virus 203]AEP15843.1 hypothetical protein EQVG_00435 [Emiliania huxleyi virus 207]AET97903.1 hypothetical protein EPVG_00015 [Emiliania huxleyi virus 201]
MSSPRMASLYDDRVSEMKREHNQSIMWAGIGFAVFIVIIGVLMFYSYKYGNKKYNEWQDEAADKKEELIKPYRDIILDPNASPSDKRQAQERITDIELRIYHAKQRNRHMHNYHSNSRHSFN